MSSRGGQKITGDDSVCRMGSMFLHIYPLMYFSNYGIQFWVCDVLCILETNLCYMCDS